MRKTILSRVVRNRLLAIVVVFALLLIDAYLLDAKHSSAADLSQFKPGNIISDSVFYNGNAMSSQEIQSFLNAKVPNCTINNGQPSHAAGAAWGSTYISDVCLKSYRQSTPDMSAQPGICAAYQGAVSETAAQIISKVGLACNINPKVLLVLLEKEQSLITDTWPTVRQISQATGFACYDNGQPCVQDYAGFFYQVWSAARQFQRYGASPFTWYPVGQISQILYQANRPECGTKSVFIENRATAALYYYTPYTPNDAALSAGYGLGDACSAYGNRNFYQLFVDWFGSTAGFNVIGAIKAKYDQMGASSSYLGNPSSNEMCGLKLGACWQPFAGGTIFYVPNVGTFDVMQKMRDIWATQNYEHGWLGYPTSNTMCGLKDNGCWQVFQGGYVFHNSATGGKAVSIQSRTAWGRHNFENGWLGYPSDNPLCGLKNSGCRQAFQGGMIAYSGTTNSYVLKSEVVSFWASNNFQDGALGYPTSDPSSTTSSYTQTFEGGTLTVSGGVVTFQSSDPFVNALANNSWLGNATSGKMCTLRNSGCWQVFQNGFLFYTPSLGAHPVKPEVRSLWAQQGYENGWLGYPTSDPSATGNNYTQTFEGGTITVTNGIARVTAASDPWMSEVISNPWLGNATSGKMCTLRNSGCWQVFQNGFLFYTPSLGAHPVKPEVRSLWAQQGYENGWLGYPTSDPSATGNNYTQTFEGGTITVTNGIARVTAASDPWMSEVISNPWLGNATSGKMCTLRNSGCWQVFQNGFLFYTPSLGAHPVKPEVRNLWAQQGYEHGWLGYPTSDPSATGNSYTQTFEGGTITVTNGIAIISAGTNPWDLALSSNTWLGISTSSKMCWLKNGGCWQVFQNGYLFHTRSTGAHPVKPEVRSLWARFNYENGWLGFPTGDPSSTGNSYTQSFEGGVVVVSNGIASVQ